MTFYLVAKSALFRMPTALASECFASRPVMANLPEDFYVQSAFIEKIDASSFYLSYLAQQKVFY